jgi:hypothetical protein
VQGLNKKRCSETRFGEKMMKKLTSVSPLRILERSSRQRLGPGHLGVLIARAGVGKTSCLIHIAFDKIFQQEKLIHISLEEGPEKITSYYNVMYADLIKALDVTDEPAHGKRMDQDRIILAYLKKSFDMERLEASLENLKKELDFVPGTLIVDGLDFETADRKIFEGFKEIAVNYGVEIWFSALSHRHITDVNERGIPYPCHQVDELFSIIIHLQAESAGIRLKLLKDHDHPAITDISIMLDPGTFLSSG